MASNHFNAHFVELHDKKGERKGIQQNNNDCQNTQAHVYKIYKKHQFYVLY